MLWFVLVVTMTDTEILYEAVLSYWSRLGCYEKKWIKLTAQNQLVICNKTRRNKIEKTVNLNIYNKMSRLENKTKLKKNDFQIEFRSSNGEQKPFKLRADTQDIFDKWMKYIHPNGSTRNGHQSKTKTEMKPQNAKDQTISQQKQVLSFHFD